MNCDSFWKPIDKIGCNLFGKRFVGAQSVEDVLLVGERLINKGYKVTYNLLGEHVTDKKTIESAVITTIKLIGRMNYRNSGNVSCKPTLYGLCLSKDLFKHNLGGLIRYAQYQGIEIEIDAESYGYIPDTFDIFSYFSSQPGFNKHVRQAVQAHLVNTESLMDKYNLWDKKIRIVKGSGVYNEDKSIAQRDDLIVIDRYMEILRRNLQGGGLPFVATVRDRHLASEAINLAKNMNSHITIQTLYGPLGSGLGNRLIKTGQPVNIYIPFTDHWCRNVWKPYGLRRAQAMRRLIWKELHDYLIPSH